MNREEKRRYNKKHKKDRNATFCEKCGINTLNKLEQTFEDDLEVIYWVCEVCGNRKEVLMKVPPTSYTTETQNIYQESI